MSAFQVWPEELTDASRVLGGVAERLREVATAAAGVGPGGAGPLLGGLDEALERAVERWRGAQRALAESADAAAGCLSRAAEVYGEADRAVTRSAGG